MLLEIRNLKKSYKLGKNNEFLALKGIDLQFDRGELISIIGESGSGKSTLMNVIGGLDFKFEGEVNLDGKNIREFKEKEIDKYRKNKIGFIFQSFNLIPHLTVLDNVTIACILSNVSKKERVLKAKDILDKVGLKDHMNKKPNQLSGGQMQRVAIARALINEPDIILADEPTGALDSKTSMQILEIIKDIARSGKLVIMVTHSEKVSNISDRVVSIADGKIIDDKKVKEVEKHDKKITNTMEKQNLSFFSALRLAYRNMVEKKARNILVSIGASIGIMAVVLMLSLGNGVNTYMNDTMQSYVNPLVVEVNKPYEEDETVSEDTGMQGPAGMGSSAMMNESEPFTDEEIEELNSLENVVDYEKAYTATAMGINTVTYNEEEVTIVSFGTISSNIVEEDLVKGKLPLENEILIDEATEEQFDEDMIGKTVEVKLNIDSVDMVKEFVVSGIYTSDGTMGDMNVSYINYDDLIKLGEENEVEIEPTTIYLTTNDQDNTEGIKEKIKELGYTGSFQESMVGMFTEMIDIITYVLAAVAGISLFVSTIMILVVLYISVVERTKEIGVLKAIGARRKDIRRIFSSEAFIIGLLSGIIGVGVAYGLGALINVFVNNMFEISVINVSLEYVIFGILVSTIVSVVAGLFPANKAAKLDPIESLRRE